MLRYLPTLLSLVPARDPLTGNVGPLGDEVQVRGDETIITIRDAARHMRENVFIRCNREHLHDPFTNLAYVTCMPQTRFPFPSFPLRGGSIALAQATSGRILPAMQLQCTPYPAWAPVVSYSPPAVADISLAVGVSSLHASSRRWSFKPPPSRICHQGRGLGSSITSRDWTCARTPRRVASGVGGQTRGDPPASPPPPSPLDSFPTRSRALH